MNNEHKLRELLNALNIKNVRRAGDWLQASCPFAPRTHDGGTDNHPSWGVSISTKPSHHVCYTCGSKGDLYSLVLDMKREAKLNDVMAEYMDMGRALEIALQDDEDVLVDLDEEAPRKKEFVAFSEDWLASFLPGHQHPYVIERGLTQELALKLDVRYDFDKQRLCFPYRDRYGRLAGMQGRDVTGNNNMRYLSYKWDGNSNPSVWMGEDQVDYNDTVILTEGPLDYAKGFGVTTQIMASMTSSLNEAKLNRLADFPNLISYYDRGTGGNHGRAMLDKWCNYCKKSVWHLLPPEGYGDMGDVPPAELMFQLKDYL